MEKLKLTSINVRGLRDEKKRFTIINWLRSKQFDIVLLQETFITEDVKTQIEKDFYCFGKMFSNCSDSSHSRGVSVIISQTI